MDKIAEGITAYYVKKHYIPEDKKDIYCYGFKLILADIINFSIVILLGILLGKVTASILFLLTLCTVRIFSGGFHSKSFWLCRLSMLITFAGVLLVSEVINTTAYDNVIICALNIVCIIIIGILAPVPHPNKRLSDEQKVKNKKKAIIISFVLSVIAFISAVMGYDWGSVISAALAAVVILMIAGLVIMKGGK
ncbi:MAG: accessory gene regulator B family protein [Clostridiales bacterium]|nr:accessory gene regulator B family protein [Clostridiales bacterium]